ncbi:tetratricopeptide repeat protein [Archangium sp.]|uniref:tetratricopeptide repeat protein n=1 Tax=Archangium sp. TaxID=1872627 RepID=UPI00286A2E38|nr:tetratricopeptide repeat protein [Archangium sp.]
MKGNRFHTSTVMVVGLLLVLAPLWRAHGQDHAARYITAGERLYESLEYERALAQFAQARRLPRTLAEDVRIALFDGLILSDMGMHDEARAAFKTALLLEPEAQLPVSTTPRVELEFEGIRKKVREELAARRQVPAQEPPRTPVVRLEPSELRDEQPSWLKSSIQVGTVSVPTPSLALVVAGALAGGVGGAFGLQSRDHLQAARDTSFRDEMVSRHGEAVGSARNANILLGTAAVLTTGAVVTWLVASAGERSQNEVAR